MGVQSFSQGTDRRRKGGNKSCGVSAFVSRLKGDNKGMRERERDRGKVGYTERKKENKEGGMLWLSHESAVRVIGC